MRQLRFEVRDVNEMLVVFVLTFTIIVLLIVRHVTRNFDYWKNRGVPYSKPLSCIVNIFKMAIQRMSIGSFAQQLYNSSDSSCLGFFVFDQPYLLIRDPDVIKCVLLKDFDHFRDRSMVENLRDDPIGSSTLFTLKSPAWKKIRTKLTPVFSSVRLRQVSLLMKIGSDQLVSHISKTTTANGTLEVKQLCLKYSTDLIASCVFGFASDSFKHENSEFRTAGRRLLDTGFVRTTHMAAYFMAPALVGPLKLKFLEPSATQFMKKIFWEAVREREKSDVVRGDFIDCIVKLRRDEEGSEEKTEDNVLIGQAAILFFAGFESTASTVTYTLYELSFNVDVQNRLRKIINETLEFDGWNYDAIRKITYLDMVLNEVLRKYPVIPFLERRCNKDYRVPNTNFTIEKNIPIYISVLGLHYDPKFFPDPRRYDPERFSEANRYNIPKCCYLPFGDGQRKCLAEQFGLLAVKIAIIDVLRKFRIEPADSTPRNLTFDGKGLQLIITGDLHLRFFPI